MPKDDRVVAVPNVPVFTRSNSILWVIRPDDFLLLGFQFINLHAGTDHDKKPILTRREKNRPAYVVIVFPPQNIAEEAFFESTDPEKVKLPPGDPDLGIGAGSVDPPPVHSRIAHQSRIALTVPNDVDAIPYDLEGLLDTLSRYSLSLAPTALPAPVLFHILDLPTSVGVVTAGSMRAGVVSGQIIPASSVDLLNSARRFSAARHVPPRFVADSGREAEIAGILSKVKLVPSLAPPARTETSLELPWRLVISPNMYAGWAHSAKPVRSPETGRTELWHTRMGVRNSRGEVSEGDDPQKAFRAIWAEDFGFSKDAFPEPAHSNAPFRTSLDVTDRHDIVHLTADFKIKGFTPLPVAAEQLMLSSLGAWLRSDGLWSPPKNADKTQSLTVQEWKHRGTMGRDHYVKVVYKGYLFPFMHRASLIKVTERKFHPKEPGNVAYMRQRMFIVVRERVRSYDIQGATNKDGHRFELQNPWLNVELKTLITPSLNPPEQSDYDGLLQSCFWPKVGSDYFPWHCVATGIDQKTVEFTVPLLFADANAALNRTLLGKVAEEYGSNSKYPDRRTAHLHGQRVVFARFNTPGDTSFESESVLLGAEIPRTADVKRFGSDDPLFYPVVRQAQVRIPALKHLARDDSSIAVNFSDGYLKKEFAGNPGEVFLDLAKGAAASIDFSSQGDRSGGLMKPNMGITALSRVTGLVAGKADTFAGGSFDPAQFFGALGAKLFGVIDLKDLLDILPVGDLGKLPRFITDNISAVESFIHDLDALSKALLNPGLPGALVSQLNADVASLKTLVGKLIADPLNAPAALSGALSDFRDRVGQINTSLPGIAGLASDARREVQSICLILINALGDVAKFIDMLPRADDLCVRFVWNPQIKHWPAANPLFIPNSPGGGLSVAVEVRAKQASPSVKVLCTLKDFDLDLIAPVTSFLVLHFEKIEFFASTGLKADVNVVLKGIEFVGVLSFVETLRKIIPLDGFSDPPGIDVTEKGIDAHYSVGLPDLPIGVFTLQNLSLGAGFTIPFIGDPLSVRFNFCERQQPFLLTVSLFGGGGFFALTIDPSGVQILEASFEFGASLALDFGVASGGVHVMAGIYFKMVKKDATLSGYLRIGGEVDVLGLISASIELYMELSYEFSSGKCTGKATITIEVHVLIFSASVHVSTERKFAGSNGDPTFAQLMAPYEKHGKTVNPWEDYLAAFAA